jgi:predicted dienelactone hydrolase
LGLLGLILAAALPMILPVFSFPIPSGPYGIGTATFHWVDPARPELFSADPNANRELVVQIWYPAIVDPGASRAPYIEHADAVTAALAGIQRLPQVIFGHFKYVTTNAVSTAPVAGDLASYPVLIYLEGATGFRQMGMFQVEELVSHGYVVAALDQPGAAATVVFPDGHQIPVPPIADLKAMIGSSYLRRDNTRLLNGRPLEGNNIIPYLTQDVSFALDRLAALNSADPNGLLTGRLDLRRVGAFGMSLGGIVVGEACLKDPRIGACLVMDAPMTFDVVAAGLRQPSMWITRKAEWMRLERQRAGGWSEDEIEAHLTSMRAVYEGLSGPGYFVQVPGMFHSNFMDVPNWFPLASLVGLSGPINGRRGHDIVNAYTVAFFDRHLKEERGELLDGPSARYPEVLFEAHAR